MLSLTEKVSGASSCLELDPNDFVIEAELQALLDIGPILLDCSSQMQTILDRLIVNEQVNFISVSVNFFSSILF